MTKSIIGYYREPLSQVEREVIYNHLIPTYNQDFTDHIVSQINMLADKVAKQVQPIGPVGEDMLLWKLNSTLARLIREFITTRYPNLKELNDIKAEYRRVSENEVTLEWGPFLKSLINKEAVLTYPAPFSEQVMIQDYNKYLHEHPEHRIFDQTEKALAIDAANTKLLNKLTSHCYESQNSSWIYDFSDILSPLVK